MNTHESSRLAGDVARPGGDKSAPGRAGTAPGEGAPPARVDTCECGHVDVLHDLRKDTHIRTACSHLEGPKATPCGCRSFSPLTASETPHA